MRTLYIDCGMGAAGDMLTAALLELFPDREAVLRELNGLQIPGVCYETEKSVKCGITGTHMSVRVHGLEEDEDLHDRDQGHDHHHGSMDEIRQIVSRLRVPGMVKLDILAVYGLIAEAESHAHGVPVSRIHFHEVGSMDAVADVAAVCLLMHRLDVDQVIASPVHVGSGHVKCAHGILPVPAPATACILKDVPIYGGEISGELCTPTGAALLKHFVTKFDAMPVMRVERIGYGMGKKDFPRANCVRIMLGQTADSRGEVLELSCNIDDMTGEALGFALEQLLAEGALDAWTTPIGMKKSRPGYMLSVLCRDCDREKIIGSIFRHTTTLGIRETVHQRYTLERSFGKIETPYGPVIRKTSFGYGVRRSKLEYEDLARIAREQGLGIGEISRKIIEKN